MTVIATCHCGGTSIELDAAPTHATSCTCTYCSKSGGLWAYYSPETPRIVSDTHGAMYSATGINHHHFCARCGCATYGLSPDWSEANLGGVGGIPEKQKFAINVRLIEDVDLKALVVEEIDGRNLW